MLKWEEHYQVINNRFPFVDLVTERIAYAYGLTHGVKKECYTWDAIATREPRFMEFRAINRPY